MSDLLYFNGINGASGDYELQPMTPEVLAKIIAGEEIDEGELNELKLRQEDHFAVREGVDPTDLAQSGWGVIFAAKDEQVPAIKEALSELLTHRQNQAGERYREYIKGKGYRPGESKNKFLARHGAGPGPADPDVVPYYLLIVGDPETIPYRFQSQLDVQYAVGRIHFDTLEEYAQYAHSVVQAETGGVALPRQATFFGVRTPGDRATELSADHMIKPLAKKVSADQPGWDVRTLLKNDTTKAHLSGLLGGGETPALLFTASHGMGFPNGDPRQLPHQGALLCQDWPGPGKHRGAIPEDFYFSGDDVGSDARLLGTMAFFFACFGAGTPKLDAFAHLARKERAAIAPRNFVSQLPRRLLGHPKGGMLAVVGHVERAWGYSFMWDRAGEQLVVFEDTLKRLMEGAPVGHAIEYFNARYAEIATMLTPMIEDKSFGEPVDDLELAGMWTANNDARGYVILGDPAARLPVVQEGGAPQKRPTIALAADLKDRLAKLEAAGDAGEPAFAATTEEAPATSAVAESPPTDYVVAFGLRDQFNDLAGSVRRFTDQLAAALGKAAADITTLEVKTYATDDLDTVAGGGAGQTKLCAFTRVGFDGDMEVYVPEEAGKVDQELWQIHMEMVREAQANRAKLLGAMAEMATNLLKSLS
jgi:hypothetical protein